MERFRLVTGDAFRVHVHRWLPESEPRAVVQIAHGMGEHAARYDHAARALNAAGFAVYANDHRGHGETAEPGRLGWLGPDGWNRLVADLGDLTAHVQEAHPGLPCILLGHSMGAMAATQYLYRFGTRLDAAVLSGSPGFPGRLMGWLSRAAARIESWRLGADAESPLLQALIFGRANRAFENGTATGYEWLSRDPAQVAAYVSDPLCGFVLRAGSLHELFRGVREARDVENVLQIPSALPLYVFSGGDDPVHEHQRNLLRLLRRYRKHLERVDVHIYPGGRHEMLNETNRDEVLADLVGWLDGVLPAPAGAGTAAGNW